MGNPFLIGVLQAFSMVFLSSFFYIFVRIASQFYDFQPITYTCVALISTSLVLALFAGPGRFVRTTIRSPQTWMYGFLLIGAYVADIYFIKYASATEVGLFNRITVPVAVILALIYVNRKPSKSDLLGNAIIILALYILFRMQAPEVLLPVIVLTIFTGVMRAGMYFVSEIHTESGKAQEQGTIRDKTRVVAFVSFVTAGLFFLLTASAAILKEYSGIEWLEQSLFYAPSLLDLVHLPSILVGLFFGVLIAPVNRYFKWASSYRIKSDTVLAILALIPVVTLFCEWLISFIPSFQSNLAAFEGERGMWLIIVVAMITCGAAFSTVMKIRANINKAEGQTFLEALKTATQPGQSTAIQNLSNALDDYEIVAAALEHTGGDKEKAAELLNMPLDTLIVLYEGKGKLALASHASQEVARRYRTHVASRDPLTGLLNRSGFMGEVKKALAEEDVTSLLFIDLNKFKPVNDTYGHEAGDYILQGVAERLTEMFPAPNHITRLGGDEYCILLPNIPKAEAKKCMTKLKKEIEKPFKLEGIKEPIGISASIGLSTAPEDATGPDALLKMADEGMYREKKER